MPQKLYLAHILKLQEAIIFSHIQHKTNSLADLLAKKRVEEKAQCEDMTLENIKILSWPSHYQDIKMQDLSSLNLRVLTSTEAW